MTDRVHTFAGNPLDRGEALRRDEDNVHSLKTSEQARILPFHKLHVRVTADRKLAWTGFDELPMEQIDELIFLGLNNQHPLFAAALKEAAAEHEYVDCRMLAGELQQEETGILAQARAQLDWHRRNPFCAECGSPTRAERGGQIRRCSGCGKHTFPRTDPVAIMLIVDQPGGDLCLLGQSQGRMAQSNFYSALAGFLDQGESLEEAVRREVLEEAGIHVGPVHYHSSQPWPFPSQLMIGCHGVAETTGINFDAVEMADVRWFTREEVTLALQEQNPELRVPGAMAIAHHLIRSWVEGEVTI